MIKLFMRIAVRVGDAKSFIAAMEEALKLKIPGILLLSFWKNLRNFQVESEKLSESLKDLAETADYETCFEALDIDDFPLRDLFERKLLENLRSSKINSLGDLCRLSNLKIDIDFSEFSFLALAESPNQKYLLDITALKMFGADVTSWVAKNLEISRKFPETFPLFEASQWWRKLSLSKPDLARVVTMRYPELVLSLK